MCAAFREVEAEALHYEGFAESLVGVLAEWHYVGVFVLYVLVKDDAGNVQLIVIGVDVELLRLSRLLDVVVVDGEHRLAASLHCRDGYGRAQSELLALCGRESGMDGKLKIIFLAVELFVCLALVDDVALALVRLHVGVNLHLEILDDDGRYVREQRYCLGAPFCGAEPRLVTAYVVVPPFVCRSYDLELDVTGKTRVVRHRDSHAAFCADAESPVEIGGYLVFVAYDLITKLWVEANGKALLIVGITVVPHCARDL